MPSQVDLSSVVGFLVPIYSDPLSGENGLSLKDFNKVRLGYACAGCLAEFKHYTVKCPLCHTERDAEADIRETNPVWQAHLDESNRPGEKTVARPMIEAIQELLGDTDNVEHVPLRQLKKRRRA